MRIAESATRDVPPGTFERMYARVFFGPVENPENRGLIDLDLREKLVLVAVIVPMFWIGLYPDYFLRRLDASVIDVLRRVESASQARANEPVTAEAGGAASPLALVTGPEVAR